MQKIQGFVEAGNTVVQTSGIQSTTTVQGSFPGATLTVYLNNPSPVFIVSITRSSNIVSASVPANSGFIVNQAVTIANVGDSGFDGIFTILTYSGTTLTWAQTGSNTSSSGGTANSTLRLATIYSDNSLTPKANPFVSANDGTWFFFVANGRYDVQFSGAGIGSPFTLSSLWVFDETVIWIDVKSAPYSASGAGGLTDDTAAIAGALSTAAANGGATVYFPPGVYNVNGPVVVPASTILKGFSMEATQINNTNTGGLPLFHTVSLANGNVIAGLITFEDLHLTGTSQSGDSSYVYAPQGVYFNRCNIAGNGGIGIHVKKGTNAIGQSVFIDNCTIGTGPSGAANLGGGVYYEGGGDIFSIKNTSINGNGRFGVYAPSVVLLEIQDCEFAGYFYGSAISGQQATAISLDGGNNILIAHTSFENNGGNNTVPSYPIKTGWNPITQSTTTNTTFCLTVEDCDFKAPNGQSGALRHIYLNFVQRAVISKNLFEKSSAYPNAVYAYQYGTLAANSNILRVGNKYFTTLDGIEFNTYSGSFLAVEDWGQTGFDQFYAQTDTFFRVPFRVQFTGEGNDRFQVMGDGTVKLGPGMSAPTQTAIGSDAFGPFFAPATVQPQVNASISGSILVTMPFVGISFKLVVIFLNGTNGTATFTPFPASFTAIPAIVPGNGISAGIVTSLSETAVTITTGSPTTGFIFIIGI